MNKIIVICDQCQKAADRQDAFTMPVGWFHLSRKLTDRASILPMTTFYEFCSLVCLCVWANAKVDAEVKADVHQNERDAQLLREASPHPLPSEQPQPCAPAQPPPTPSSDEPRPQRPTVGLPAADFGL